MAGGQAEEKGDLWERDGLRSQRGKKAGIISRKVCMDLSNEV